MPIVVWAITSGEMRAAFFLFVAAGISDAVDGFLAKRFHMTSELGALIDPLADKALIVSIYVALSIAGALPISLVILVVSRDIMIISGFMVSWVVAKPMPVRPHPVSKANTAAQIVLATLVLAERAFGFDASLAEKILIGLGCGLDAPFHGLLSRRMAASHELAWDRPLIEVVRVRCGRQAFVRDSRSKIAPAIVSELGFPQRAPRAAGREMTASGSEHRAGKVKCDAD